MAVKAGTIHQASSNGYISLLVGWQDIRDIPVFICYEHPDWFKDVSLDYMSEEQRLEEIKKNFIKIKQAYDWCTANEDQQFLEQKLLPALEKVYTELEQLGVDKEFSSALFVMGGVVDDKLVNQFKKSS